MLIAAHSRPVVQHQVQRVVIEVIDDIFGAAAEHHLYRYLFVGQIGKLRAFRDPELYSRLEARAFQQKPGAVSIRLLNLEAELRQRVLEQSAANFKSG